MKSVIFGVAVVVLMAIAGGAGYYFGDQSGFTRAQNIRTEFINQRFGAQAQGAGTDPTQSQGTQPGQQRGGGQGGQGGIVALGGRPVAQGTVKSVEGNNIVVTQQDGTTTTVTFDDKTTVQKQVNGTLTDLTAGTRIVVTEQNNLKRIQIMTTQ